MGQIEGRRRVEAFCTSCIRDCWEETLGRISSTSKVGEIPSSAEMS